MPTDHVNAAELSVGLTVTYLSRRYQAYGRNHCRAYPSSIAYPLYRIAVGDASATLTAYYRGCAMVGAPKQRIRCVGAVILDDAGQLLLVRRAREPGRGRWSVPGGRVETGESDQQAVIREVAEETGLVVEIARLLGNVQRRAPDGALFDIYDYRCRVVGGTLVAGDDADETRWCDSDTLRSLPLVPGLLAALTHWHALPR